MADIWVQPILTDVEEGRNTTKSSLCGKTDSFGTQFKADIHTEYQDPTLQYPVARLWREDTGGNIIGDRMLFEMPIPPGDTIAVRLDDIVMTVAGHNIHLRMSGHGATDDNTHRRHQYDFEYVWLGVYNPGGAPGEPEGAETFISTGTGGGGTVEVDYDEIERRMQFVADHIDVSPEVEGLFNGGQGSPKVFEQLINTGFSAGMVVEYTMGRWDGKLPDGTYWRHPLSGRPINESPPWVTRP